MATEQKEYKVRIPLFPTYSTVQSVMNTINGVPKQSVTRLIQNIWAQTGTPQKPVDWSEPDKWIPDRLTDEDASLAKRIWEESRHEVNPRHIYGVYLLINNYALLSPDNEGNYRLSEHSKFQFVDNHI